MANGSQGTVWSVKSQNTPFMTGLSAYDNKIYRTVQSSSQGNVITSSSSSGQGYSKQWNVTTDFINFAQYASVFDQYRIAKIEVWASPSGPGCSDTYTNTVAARIYSAVDYDDANTVSLSATLLQYPGCRVGDLSEGHYHSFKPHVATGVYNGSVFTAFANQSDMWIDCASSNAQHFGFKLIVDPTVSNSDILINVFTRMTLEFRNPI